EARETAEEGQVIVERTLGRGRLVLAQVDAERHGRRAEPFERALHRGHAPVVEAEGVPESLRLGIAEHPRPRVARLGQGRHGADLQEAEAESGEATDGAPVLVESCGEADRVRKRAAPELHGEARIVRAVALSGEAPPAGNGL